MTQSGLNQQDLLYRTKFMGVSDTEFDKFLKTRDNINVLKSIDRPWPKKYNRNQEPIISSTVRDIVKDRYKKRRITCLLLDSKDRDISLYPKPNNYRLNLGYSFKNIEAITIRDTNLNPNDLCNNLTFSWDTYTINIQSNNLNELNTALAQTQSNSYINIINNQNSNNTIIISRQEEIRVMAIQSILPTSPTDIFANYPPITYNADYIYVMVALPQIDTRFLAANTKIIFTNLPRIGGISPTLLNNIEFTYNNNITALQVGEYSLFDVIAFNIPPISYQRIAIRPNKQPTHSENITYGINYGSSIGFEYINQNVGPFVGRSNPITINFDGSTVMKLLKWYECAPIQSRAIYNSISTENIWPIYDRKINTSLYPYILLKLRTPSQPADTIANNLVKTQDMNGLQADNCDTNNLFAQIYINNLGEVRINSTPLEFSEKILEELDEINIKIVDSSGCLIDIQCEYMIVIELIEVYDVLKDTQIDSRIGETNEVGIKARSSTIYK